MKRVLVPGISPVQADFIRVCRKRGFEVYTCANSDRGPGRELSDGFELIDVTDTAGVLGYARRICADLVYTVGSDVAMPTMCRVSEELELPRFISSETARVCSSKHLLRSRLGQDFPGNLRFQILERGDEEIQVPFPLMMKPVDSQGQRGVRPVESREDIPAFFPESVSFSRSGKVIAEELVEGPEVAVIIYLVEGAVMTMDITDRFVWEQFPGGILKKVVSPGAIGNSPENRTEIRNLIGRTVEKLGIRNGPVSFQIKIAAGGPKLIEVAPRVGGAHFWRVNKLRKGFDQLETLLSHLMGDVPPPDRFPSCLDDDAVWELEFFCDFPDVPFTPEKFDFSGAEYVEWYYAPGEKIHRATGLYEKVGYLIRKLAGGEKTGCL